MNECIFSEILVSLNILVLERQDINSFKLIGTIPDWVRGFYHHDVGLETARLIPQEVFPFLENFLLDAEDFWQLNNKNQIQSGIWYQNNLWDTEYHFEASAINISGKKILLIELKEESFEEKQYIIQKARENKLNYQQILKEAQKKEVLIHCIIHDVAGQLSGINCCLALLELENLTPKGRERLEIGKKQSYKQEMLIREILDAFSAELNSLESFIVDADNAPDALVCARDVIELLNPTFTLNKMRLQLVVNEDTADWRVVGDKSRLDRVIANLTENAFRHSPPESTVTISLQQDNEYIIVTVDDEGSGVTPENVDNLFKKFSQGKSNPGRIGLGLYFCRITVERWGGTIGYSPRPQSGSRFWFRLPKPNLGVSG